MLLPLIYIFFLITAGAAYFPVSVQNMRRTTLILGILSAMLTFVFYFPVLFGNLAFMEASLFRIDRFSAFIGTLIATLYLFTVLINHRYVHHEQEEGIMSETQVRLYYLLVPLFALAMLTVVMADNLGLMWLALETTTLVTTPLVAIYKKDGSLEAAWKYMILCSIGISLGLLGVLLISYAGVQSGLSVADSLSLKALASQAHSMIPAVMQWGFVFAFIGLGTKVGYFPMHTWLPDAHGRTPSPISAMLSGILLNVALYALLRIKIITDISLGSDQWTNNLFLFFGLASVVTSGLFLFFQRNYKRMLAYSSMEHMGLISLAIGLGPLGLVPAIMHMASHTFSKSLVFYGSGEILLATKTTKIEKIHGLINRLPKTGVLFIVGLVSLLGFPPFAAFSSEMMMLSAAVTKGQLVPFFLILVSLSIVCVSLLKHTFAFFTRDDQEENGKPAGKSKEKLNVTHVVMIIELLILVALFAFMFTQTGISFFSSIANSLHS